MSRLPGFSPQFDSIQQFILTLTHVVWEQKDIGQLADFYATPVVFQTPEKRLTDLSQFMRLTLEAMHSFPQRKVLTEDILCSHSAHNEYYAAQRSLACIQHSGEGFYGLPSGNTLWVRTFTDRICAEGAVRQEWLLQDRAAIINQIGLNVREFACELVRTRQEAGIEMLSAEELDALWAGGPEGDDVEGALAGLVERYLSMWAGGNSGVVPGLYHPAATLHGPGHVLRTGEQDIGAFLSGYRASFADSETQLHHLIVRRDANEPVRLSLRWSLLTWHDGYGQFGAPSRRPISITGISQLELRDGLIIREYLGIDELAIWSQIYS
ncbi:nuclear transport factor 2 family protein [Scandinavium manionii]|uniref:nuclear transport factor 2 family protein n=1 Tax=Scandinavium manionii TaxID=2926520 RepID=UPI0013580375|nr:nuclear transport factor 2 family protein [Scandinavium manionii]MCS2147910.1 nuclear transport factor 2 family protein [Scandinavium manionii]MCS2166358.1 nuclear transport factor 2 family protein [Scandinavium manionii]